MRFALVLLLLLAVAAGMFALAGRATDPVEVDTLGRVTMVVGGYRLTTAFGVVLAVATALGLVLGMLVMAPAQFAAGRRAKQAQKRLDEVEAARSEAAAARSMAAAERTPHAAGGASETQRLADEVARRTQSTGPPPRP
jgi:uncharacterized membrane protein YciS (DUF1049 family)